MVPVSLSACSGVELARREVRDLEPGSGSNFANAKRIRRGNPYLTAMKQMRSAIRKAIVEEASYERIHHLFEVLYDAATNPESPSIEAAKVWLSYVVGQPDPPTGTEDHRRILHVTLNVVDPDAIRPSRDVELRTVAETA